jgi:hypothetical protein
MQANDLIRLNLGCGAKKLEGWINIDAVESCKPDLIHDLSKPLPFGDLTVDEVAAKDLLEHFDKYARYKLFYDWARVLKINGKIHLEVPNVKKIVYRYFKLPFDNFLDLMFGENLLESRIYLGHFGNHKWGYSTNSLKVFVSQFGFSDIKIEEQCLNIKLEAQKVRHVTEGELDNLQIFSSANIGENEKKQVTFKEAKLLINEE